ncbi:TonB family protein [candidate division KSB1 bacterium]
MVSIISNLGASLGQWIETLWNISWQISILFIIVLFISFLSRKASPVFHYSLWSIILIRAAVPLNLPFSFNKFQQTLDFVPASIPYTIPEFNYAQSTSLLTAENILTFVWMLFVVLIAFIIVWRSIKLNHSLKKRSILVEREDIISLTNQLAGTIGLKKAVPVYYMNLDKEYGPAVAGIFKPGIYLPKWMADKWTAPDIEPVLLHELAHIKRHDLIVNWIQIIVQVVYFFHPLVWAANWKIRKLREDICDDIAIEYINTEKRRYGESILRVIEEMIRQPVWGMGGIGYTENKSSLTRRIKRIMSNTYKINRKITIASEFILLFVAVIGFALASESPAIEESINSVIQDEDLDLNTSYGIIGGLEQLYKDLKYPKEAKNNEIVGIVMVKVHIKKDGTPEMASVDGKGLGYGCNKAAVEAVSKQRFISAMKEGKPVSFWMKIPVEFSLPDLPRSLPLENQPKIIGGYASIMKYLKYPEIARKAGIEGTVILRTLIGKDGKPEKVEVAKGLENGGLGCNEAAIKAVKKVRFTPAVKDGKPVKFWFTIPIKFKLNEKKN